jgi:hypothetical protein
MTTVVLASYNLAGAREFGGHVWVYLQYAEALRRLGCEVFWLESFPSSGDRCGDALVAAALGEQLAPYGLDGTLIVRTAGSPARDGVLPSEYIGAVSGAAAEAVFRRADLLLNFNYALDPTLLSLFRRTALVDIDPGLLQLWMTRGQLAVQPHDVYFTTGETVGTGSTTIPDCGFRWIPIHPPLCLELWPYVHDARCEAFTTVSSWWAGEWVADGEEVYDNNKRFSFMEFARLPRMTTQPLELALCLGPGDEEEKRALERQAWRVRHSFEVAQTAQHYQSYIQQSRGEFSCAKPSCMRFQNAWVSDRTVAYLASGKPVVVQNTGPSAFLPNGEGMFRFSTIEEAAGALKTINADYERHCRRAREIAETYFDAQGILCRMLDHALR